jgi:hypothetical protein
VRAEIVKWESRLEHFCVIVLLAAGQSVASNRMIAIEPRYTAGLPSVVPGLRAFDGRGEERNFGGGVFPSIPKVRMKPRIARAKRMVRWSTKDVSRP